MGELTLIKAIELWKRWFDWSGNPWTDDGNGFEMCFFCKEDKPKHEPNCIYLEAKKLIELDERGELV